MKKIIFLAVLTVLGACGGGGSSSDESGGLVGTYNGSLSSSNGFSSSLIIIITSDDGSNFSGNGSIPNSDAECGRSFAFAGTRTGNNLSAGGTTSQEFISSFNATFNGRTISGSFTTVRASCGASTGSFSVSK